MQLSNERVAPIIIATNMRLEPLYSTTQDTKVRKWLESHDFDSKKDSLSSLYCQASKY